MRENKWYWRVWWWCGYNLGIYKIDWWFKKQTTTSTNLEEQL